MDRLYGSSRERLLALVEPLLYGRRIPCLIVVGLLSAVMLRLALLPLGDNGFLRWVPADHPYLGVLDQYQEDFGGANVVLIALEQVDRSHDLYNERFLDRLKHVTEAAMALPGIDRARVSSLFTADLRLVEPGSGALVGSRVLPPNFKPTAALLERLRANVARGGYIGRYTTADQTGALVLAPVRPSPGGADPDYRALGALLEERVRARYQDTAITIRISGHPSRIHELAALRGAVLERLAGTFVLMCLLMMLHLGSVRLSIPALGCALAAVVWQRGLANALDVHFDYLSFPTMLLVLALALLHSALFAGAWIAEIAQGRNGYDASLAAFRRLLLPALIVGTAAVAVLFTLQAVPVAHDRDSATGAALGVLGLCVTHGVLLPVWFSYWKVSNLEAFVERQRARAAWFALAERALGRLAQPRPAAMLIGVAAVIVGWALWQAQALPAGGAARAAPELRADSRYNTDAAAMTAAFPSATEVLRVIAETDAQACTQHDAMEQIDRFGWMLQNTAGVVSVLSLPAAARKSSAALSHDNPRFAVLPRSKYWMAQAITPIASSSGLLNPDCSAMPVLVRTRGHEAALLQRIAGATEAFNRYNAQRWFAQNDGADPAYCADKQAARRAWGEARVALRDYAARVSRPAEAAVAVRRQNAERARARFESMSRACPVNFALASGPLAVTLATAESLTRIPQPLNLWMFAALALFAALATRSLPAALCIAAPVYAVATLALALLVRWEIPLSASSLLVPAFAALFAQAAALHVFIVIDAQARAGMTFTDACSEGLRQTARPIVLGGGGLALALVPWLGSPLQFQADAARIFIAALCAGVIAALWLCPALYRYLVAPAPS